MPRIRPKSCCGSPSKKKVTGLPMGNQAEDKHPADGDHGVRTFLGVRGVWGVLGKLEPGGSATAAPPASRLLCSRGELPLLSREPSRSCQQLLSCERTTSACGSSGQPPPTACPLPQDCSSRLICNTLARPFFAPTGNAVLARCGLGAAPDFEARAGPMPTTTGDRERGVDASEGCSPSGAPRGRVPGASACGASALGRFSRGEGLVELPCAGTRTGGECGSGLHDDERRLANIAGAGTAAGNGGATAKGLRADGGGTATA
mmetsp:Transcript_39842/g.124279  ORF Transcript_39842/g.124279 Transcript_39842/m.124279 type:complete len:261 (+) Transcript_39842:957-1739(+)